MQSATAGLHELSSMNRIGRSTSSSHGQRRRSSVGIPRQGGGLFAVGVGGRDHGLARQPVYCSMTCRTTRSRIPNATTSGNGIRGVLMPRLEPHGSVVLIQQRWGEDDIPGRIMDSPEGAGLGNGAASRRLRRRTIRSDATLASRFGRNGGRSTSCERQKVAMGSRAFVCAFQGDPVPAEGNLIKAEWLQRYDKAPATFEHGVFARSTQRLRPAFGTTTPRSSSSASRRTLSMS